MDVRDPATWPKAAGLYYKQFTRVHPIAHAFHGGTRSLCNGVPLTPGGGVIPTREYTRLCSNCIGGLRIWGYLSRSEEVEWST